jgi:hypothetical protein
MPTGSGLDAQFGVAQETTWGLAATADRFIEITGESLKYDPNWIEEASLHRGIKFKRATHAQVSRSAVTGDFTFNVNTIGMGRFVRNMLGSATATTTLISGSAYKQIHVPGDYRGLGLTAQVGRPEAGTGTVRAHTYEGLKVVKWDFSVKDNSFPELKLGVDGQAESTATGLATAAYLTGAAPYNFSQAVLKLGGTATTTAGETTIATGVPVVAIVKDFALSGSTPMATERYGLGNGGQKSEPLENGIPTITGKLSAEYAFTELYTPFVAGTVIPIQFDLVGPTLGATTYLFSIILPACKIKSASPTVSGPDIVQTSLDFEAYSDETNPVIQIKIQSTETTAV